MEKKGLGGAQAASPRKDTFQATHWNFSLECNGEDEDKLIEVFKKAAKELNFTFKEVGGGPTRFVAKRCPYCKNIIHYMCIDCGHCGKEGLK